MNTLLLKTLVQREWLQHRRGWLLAAAIPLLLLLLGLAFGTVDLGDDGEVPPLVALVAATMLGTAMLSFIVMCVAAIVFTLTLPRRDHGDRSIEFWLSLPVGHATSLGVPMAVHLLLLPVAGLLIGLLGSVPVSLVLAFRLDMLGDWTALPWAQMLAAGAAVVGRLLFGLPLAVLWLLPVLLLAMLAMAWLRIWGLPVLGLALGLGGYVLDRLFGQPWPLQFIGELLRGAAGSLAGASADSGPFNLHVDKGDPAAALQLVPMLARDDLLAALGWLGAPTFWLGLLMSAGLFALLVDWRRRGAGVAGG